MPDALIEMNVLASDLANAQEVAEASQGRAYVGVLTKDFDDAESAAARVREYEAAGVRVSIGLGAGDATMWARVADVAASTTAEHVNQVLPATGYTIGRLGGRPAIVNALIAPGSEPGRVRIGTGPASSSWQDEVSVDAAAAMLADIGAPSVKLFPIRGLERLDDLRAMARAAVAAGLPILEPTGGIDLDNVRQIVDACVDEGCTHVIPHVYTSIVDPATSRTRVDDVERLERLLR